MKESYKWNISNKCQSDSTSMFMYVFLSPSTHTSLSLSFYINSYHLFMNLSIKGLTIEEHFQNRCFPWAAKPAHISFPVGISTVCIWQFQFVGFSFDLCKSQSKYMGNWQKNEQYCSGKLNWKAELPFRCTCIGHETLFVFWIVNIHSFNKNCDNLIM